MKQKVIQWARSNGWEARYDGKNKTMHLPAEAETALIKHFGRHAIFNFKIKYNENTVAGSNAKSGF